MRVGLATFKEGPVTYRYAIRDWRKLGCKHKLQASVHSPSYELRECENCKGLLFREIP